LSETEKWKLVPVPCQQVTCSNCGYNDTAEGKPEQAIAELKRQGWRLRSNGPLCHECVLDDELSSDSSEVRPK
jgi:hypothetical protein